MKSVCDEHTLVWTIKTFISENAVIELGFLLAYIRTQVYDDNDFLNTNNDDILVLLQTRRLNVMTNKRRFY